MSTVAGPIEILSSLESRRSRASAAAIGHRYALSNVPPAVQIRAIAALREMVCDWSVAILEQLVENAEANPMVRLRALRTMADLLLIAVDRGYREISRAGVAEKLRQAGTNLDTSTEECPATTDLACHLAAAIENGFFESLPDF